jgi:hypothetical protein
MQRARDRDQRFDAGTVTVPWKAYLFMDSPLGQSIPRPLPDFPRDSARTREAKDGVRLRKSNLRPIHIG